MVRLNPPRVNTDQCHYLFDGIILECKYLEQIESSLGDDIKDNTTLLILKKCKNIHMDERVFSSKKYEKLKSLIISDNEEFAVGPNGFGAFKNLETLRISHQWHEINNDSFLGLRRLKVLNLSGNEIKTLNLKSFRNLINLDSLDLSNNKIATIPPRVFEDLSMLDRLDLSSNVIKDLPGQCFSNFKQLTFLNLANNSLERIRTEQFNTLENLESLTLYSNNINEISGSFNLYKLKFLNLADNKLSLVSTHLFRGCPQLLSVDLANNMLKELSEEPFLHLTSLKHLQLTGNGISIEKFNDLRNTTLLIY